MDYIAIESPAAATELVRRVLRHIEQLAYHADSGSRLPELARSRYRQILEPPCRVFHRRAERFVTILHVMRAERLLDVRRLEAASEE